MIPPIVFAFETRSGESGYKFIKRKGELCLLKSSFGQLLLS